MATLTLGLAAGKTSYFDQVTNLYITLDKPVQEVSYDENDMEATVKKLDKITHALLGSVPALRLYKGQLPEECITAWEKKYMRPFNSMTHRKIVVHGKEIGEVKFADPVRNNMDSIGKPIEPNRAFDRGDKVNAASAKVVAAQQVGEVEEVEVEVQSLALETEAPKEEVVETKKRTTKAKADK